MPSSQSSFGPSDEEHSQALVKLETRVIAANAEAISTTNLEDLQTDEQRRILDTVAQVRKCGLESILSLPQLVVCGDQSAGKSSVLEALTEIPFPRNDNLCTRFATEIILRHGNEDSLTIKVIPDPARVSAEKTRIAKFKESIIDFCELPRVMDLAMATMGIRDEKAMAAPKASAFAKDVLSIEIKGPSRPQLTLVDIPGLIQSSTKGVSDGDVSLVTEITDHYISQPRTICLAVVSATNDAANQSILRKVRVVDPNGDRTLGIITKPDRIPSGSGSESKFIELARNEDVFFKLGWHVLRNRAFEQSSSSLDERNSAETAYFRTSNFKDLPKENVGISALRRRLSVLLFEHVKNELPKLRGDLESALEEAQTQLELLGERRSAASECKAYLSQLSLDFWEICKAAVNGHYEAVFFHSDMDEEFSTASWSAVARLRAVVQHLNTKFGDVIRSKGHKYHLQLTPVQKVRSDGKPRRENDAQSSAQPIAEGSLKRRYEPCTLGKVAALKWVRKVLVRTRGKELVGNFNPLLIGELFWEQSSHWRKFAEDHIDQVARTCEKFLRDLLAEKCPKDVTTRIWTTQIADKLKTRRRGAMTELDLIMQDVRSFPINYNHCYTDTITKQRRDRQQAILNASIAAGTTTETFALGFGTTPQTATKVDVEKVVAQYNAKIDPDMEGFSCEEALDCVMAIYKVQQKTFIANVTTQVIERHIVRGLENIFSPVIVNGMSNAEVAAIASEPASAIRQREFLGDRIEKLEAGHEILREILGATRL